MSGMNEENNAGYSGVIIPECVREPLHIRQALCKELDRLADALPDNLDAEIKRLTDAFASAPEIPPEFAELLDKEFAKAAARAQAARHAVEERRNQTEMFQKKLDSLIAADDLLTLREIEEFDRGCSEKLGSIPAGFTAALEPFRSRLVAEAEAEEQRAGAAIKLAEELETLVAAEDIVPLRDRKAAIEEAYSAIGKVPPRAAQKYKESHHKAALRIAQHFETLDLARWESYTLKMDICAELDRLNSLTEKELPETAKALHEIREKWKTLGAVPREKHEEINAKFLEVTRQLQHKVDEYFSRRRQERRQAVADKTALCDEAEKNAESTEWNKTSALFRDLQSKWKAIPHAGGEDGALYARFRAAADRFFNARNVYFSERDRHYQEISEKKNALIAEAETLADGDIRRAKQLREDFRAAGNAGRTEPELMARLNTALDHFFNRRRELFADKEKQGEALIAELKSLVADPCGNLTRSREIREALREHGCRSQENAIRDAVEEFERALSSARKRQNEEKGDMARSVARELAEKYAAFKRDGKTEFSIPAAAALFPKLNTAAQLLAQAVSGEDDKAMEKLEKQIRHAAAEHERICAELEKFGGVKESGPAHSLAAELEAAIKGNFAGTEAKSAARAIDPVKLAAEYLNAGLLPPEELDASFRRFDAAWVRALKDGSSRK